MEPVFTMYGSYLAVSIAMTIWVARTLSKHGRHFLIDVFGGDMEKADATNHLLVVGFYLVNLGFVCFHMSVTNASVSSRDAIELLSWKVGTVLGVLGVMHFFNLYVFSRIRKSATQRHAPTPPLPPVAHAEPFAVRTV